MENTVASSLLTPTHPMLTLTSKENKEILRFEQNGDIFLKGKLIENDLDVVAGFRELLNLSPVS